MISFEKSELLLKLPKMVGTYTDPGILKNELAFESKIPFCKKFILMAPDDDEISFLYDITQSPKNHFKFSLYLMCNDGKIGLVRVDFNGKHKNPDGINEYVPDRFKKYAGRWFEYDEPHIHYNIDGYDPMRWAIPLEDESFKVKSINNQNDVISAFFEFNKLINLQTKFSTGSVFLV